MEKVHHKNRSQPASKIGCEIHETIAQCLDCLQTSKRISEIEDKEWAEKLLHYPYSDHTPDWDLLECGCPITEWWTCICGLRRYARVDPPHIMHEYFRVQMAECPMGERQMMHKFHDLMQKWWDTYEELNIIRPRWMISILETYVDMGHHIGPNYTGNAMSVVSMIQMEKFARTLLYNAEINWTQESCREYERELARGGERYHPYLTKPETQIGYVYTFLFARLHDLLQSTPLLYKISKPLIQGIIESKEGVLSKTDEHVKGPKVATTMWENFDKGTKK